MQSSSVDSQCGTARLIDFATFRIPRAPLRLQRAVVGWSVWLPHCPCPFYVILASNAFASRFIHVKLCLSNIIRLQVIYSNIWEKCLFQFDPSKYFLESSATWTIIIEAGEDISHFYAFDLLHLFDSFHSEDVSFDYGSVWLVFCDRFKRLPDFTTLFLHPANCHIYFLICFGCADPAWFDHPNLTIMIASINFDNEGMHRWICSCPIVMLILIVVPQPMDMTLFLIDL